MKLTQYFIASSEAKKGVASLLVLLGFYFVAWLVIRLVGAFFGAFPLIGFLISIVVWLAGVYLGCCAIVAVLAFFKIVE